MRHHVLLTIFASLIAPVAAPDEQALGSRVTHVTVYADRARVTRVSTFNQPAGTARFAFSKLPGWIDEGSVQLGVVPADAGELLDVQVLTTYLARPDDEELRKAEAAVQALIDQAAALDDEVSVLEVEAKHVDAIRVFSLEKLPKDAATREVRIEEYGGVVRFVSDTLLQIARARRELQKKRRDLQPEMQARQKKLNELRQRAQLEQRTVIATLKSPRPQDVTLTLTYMLPGATWEPVHELRSTDGAGSVSLSSFAIVTQTTGEDWEGAQLSLSTQHSTDTIRIPELGRLLVGEARPLPRAGVREPHAFDLASERFAGQIATWNYAVNPRSTQDEFTGNVAKQKAVQARVARQFQELQEERGTTAHFAALAPQTVRTDGRTVRVPIGTVQLAAQVRTVAAPEVSPNAARTAELVNQGTQPLLPGKVLLYVDGAFLGMTELAFVAEQESFPLFLGVADQIKLSRTLDKAHSKLVSAGSRTRMQVAYLLTVENLGHEPAAVQLADRVPLSETDEVRVFDVKLTPTVKPDTNGLVKWEVKLAPKERREFHIEYALDYPTDLTQRPEVEEAREEGEAGVPSEAIAPSNETLRRRIRVLEKALK